MSSSGPPNDGIIYAKKPVDEEEVDLSVDEYVVVAEDLYCEAGQTGEAYIGNGYSLDTCTAHCDEDPACEGIILRPDGGCYNIWNVPYCLSTTMPGFNSWTIHAKPNIDPPNGYVKVVEDAYCGEESSFVGGGWTPTHGVQPGGHSRRICAAFCDEDPNCEGFFTRDQGGVTACLKNMT